MIDCHALVAAHGDDAPRPIALRGEQVSDLCLALHPRLQAVDGKKPLRRRPAAELAACVPVGHPHVALVRLVVAGRACRRHRARRPPSSRWQRGSQSARPRLRRRVGSSRPRARGPATSATPRGRSARRAKDIAAQDEPMSAAVAPAASHVLPVAPSRRVVAIHTVTSTSPAISASGAKKTCTCVRGRAVKKMATTKAVANHIQTMRRPASRRGAAHASSSSTATGDDGDIAAGHDERSAGRRQPRHHGQREQGKGNAPASAIAAGKCQDQPGDEQAAQQQHRSRRSCRARRARRDRPGCCRAGSRRRRRCARPADSRPWRQRPG